METLPRGKIAADGADGVRIGLYLTRAIVTAQGGWAFYHNTETGAVFSMMMPRYETVKRNQKDTVTGRIPTIRKHGSWMMKPRRW